MTCREFWNPDVFGYNGQLPQIMRQSGITRFLTQKLSWNRFNPPLHHTFMWQGIDGSEVLTHFPPADTYTALTLQGNKNEITRLRDNARAYKDHVRSRHSLLLFGFGDGGGGPTPRMLEICAAWAICRVCRALSNAAATSSFVARRRGKGAAADGRRIVLRISPRHLYLSGRREERQPARRVLLHEIEFLATVAARLGRGGGGAYPRQELARLWRLLLLNQFHDILPGSSIGEVYVDAARDHAEIQRSGEARGPRRSWRWRREIPARQRP